MTTNSYIGDNFLSITTAVTVVVTVGTDVIVAVTGMTVVVTVVTHATVVTNVIVAVVAVGKKTHQTFSSIFHQCFINLILT